jgi:hypothetical protein
MEWTGAIGVDTHKGVHVAVALDRLGAQLASREIPTTPAGYRRLLSWAQELGVPAFATPPKEMGVILGIAVLLDALLVRLVLIPTLLRVLGRSAWAFPRWLDRLLPDVRFGHS